MSNGNAAAGDGLTITLQGVKYAKGLGVHAGSDITYTLNGSYERFVSDIGVDDEVGTAGSVVFQVFADGVSVYNSGAMTGSTATKTIDIDVTGVNQLRLVVTDNGNGITNDHADWANARLLSGLGVAAPIKINYQLAGAPIPAGYLTDTGIIFGDRGNGFSYGWSSDHTDQSRDRGVNADQRLDTLIHFEVGQNWEIALPGGSYAVTVAIGDPSNASSHTLNVEGVNYWNNVAVIANEFRIVTREVTVADGRLTLNMGAAPDKATRINFIEITDLTVSSTGNRPPSAPTITEPATANQQVSGFDVHMEIGNFIDPDAGQSRSSTDWEIWTTGASPVRVWSALGATGEIDHHIHLGDGIFEGPQAGKTKLEPSTTYQLRVRHRDDSGDPLTDTSAYAARNFITIAEEPSTAAGWVARQAGFVIEEMPFSFQHTDAGWRLPTNIVFVPQHLHQTGPDDPFFYVMELYGSIKVVTNNFEVHTYATSLLNYNPSGPFGGSGENGSTGLVIDPVSGDLYATMLFDDLSTTSTDTFPKVTRFISTDGGLSASQQIDILKMTGESMRQSHIISNITFGPDDKLYVHIGDGFSTSTAQNLASFRGKIIRINRDGTPVNTNPFYNAADGITARDYVYAYGFRNPFGGAWRDADPVAGTPAQHFTVENGPSRDRLSMLVAGRNYLWDGTDASMNNFNIAFGTFENGAPDWNPSPAPVNITFLQNSVFSNSLFPASMAGHAFVTLSGSTHGQGPNAFKSIEEWIINPDGTRRVSAAGEPANPRELISYEGAGYSTAAGLAAGPDGLYFSTLYPDTDSNATALGAKILRVRYLGVVDFAANVTTGLPGLTVSFTDLSDVPQASAWHWHFGDGTSSDERNPTHTYAAEGTYDVELEVTGANGEVTRTKTGFIVVSNSGTGLRGEYFNNINFTAPVLTRIDPTINFNFGTGSPDPSIGADTFSVRWTGRVRPQFSQTYTFYTNTDDGVRLTVNGQVLIDRLMDQSPTEWSGTITLQADVLYDIKLEYFENASTASASLSWSSASQPKQIIPQARLFGPNLAPVISAGPDATVNEDAPHAFTGSIADPDGGDTHTITWNFGDGSPEVTGTLAPSHIYKNPGNYTATLTVRDSSNNLVSDNVSISVNNVVPAVTAVMLRGVNWSETLIDALREQGQGDWGYALPIMSGSPVAPLYPWTNIDQVIVEFNEHVTVLANHLALHGVNTSGLSATSFSYDPATFVARWTLPTLGVDRWLIDLAAAVTDDTGAPLAAGFTTRFDLLPGDVNRSGSVLGEDVILVRNAQFKAVGSVGYDVMLDVNGSGVVLSDDLIAVRNRQFTTLPAGEPAAPQLMVLSSQELLQLSETAVPSIPQSKKASAPSEKQSQSIWAEVRPLQLVEELRPWLRRRGAPWMR